jgi:UPF0755 protein
MRALLGVLVALGIGAGVWLSGALTHPMNRLEAPVVVEIPSGLTGKGIVSLLEDQGLVRHPEVVYWYFRYEGSLSHVEAGTHEIPPGLSAVELARVLVRPAMAREITLTLIPGESIWEAARRIEDAGLGPASAVTRLAADHAYVTKTLGLPAGPPRARRPDRVQSTYLDGFLYPETHRFDPAASVEDVLLRVTGEFTARWSRLLTKRRSDHLAVRELTGLTDPQLITLASLVEEETSLASEGPKIAGVFYNRLAKGMPLQTDPTLMYTPDRVGGTPTPAERRDVTNPYNTYAGAGALPPGPICSPAAGALLSVLAPERHDLLYFVARRDGQKGHVFSRTYEEHKGHVREQLGGR